MTRRPPCAGLIALLCFIALLGMQAIGGVRGYISNCGDAQHWTVTAIDPCSPNDASGPCGHEQVREDVQVRLLPALMAPTHVPVLIAALGDLGNGWSTEWTGRVAHTEKFGGPPRSVAVARTVVLLI